MACSDLHQWRKSVTGSQRIDETSDTVAVALNLDGHTVNVIIYIAGQSLFGRKVMYKRSASYALNAAV